MWLSCSVLTPKGSTLVKMYVKHFSCSDAKHLQENKIHSLVNITINLYIMSYNTVECIEMIS